MAEIKPNYDTDRQRLTDIIPLPHPFTIYIEQTKYCNFKCYQIKIQPDYLVVAKNNKQSLKYNPTVDAMYKPVLVSYSHVI